MGFQVIPAIDIRGGRCVRLFQGDYARETVYGDDPVEVARRWAAFGAPLIHVVDLDGAKAGAPVNGDVLASICAASEVPVEVSGGMRSLDDVAAAFAYGAGRVQLGSAAVRDHALVREACQRWPGAIVAAIDAHGGQVMTDGWTEGSGVAAHDLARTMAGLGVGRVMFTDISRDGALSGPNVEALGELVASLSVPVVASGGVTTMDHLRAIAAIGCEGAIVGKALYEGRIDLAEALALASDLGDSDLGPHAMLTRRIIPCFDVDNGRVVKGISFVELRDAGDPVELAKVYDAEGADELVFLDITASSDDRATVYDMVAATADQVFIPFTVGGGIRSAVDMKVMLELGADKVSVNTSAILEPDLISEGAYRFGSQCIVVAIDARAVPGKRDRWEVFTHGGRKPTGLDAVEWAREATRRGAGELLVTSMDTDGHQSGYDLGMLRAISEAVTVPVIASGGAGGPEHMAAALTDGKADAVLAASIFHFGTYSIRAVKEHLAAAGIPVRLGDA